MRDNKNTDIDNHWERPELFDGRELPRQKDLLGLFKPDGERYGEMEVDNYPTIAVARCHYQTQTAFENPISIANVPAVIGFVSGSGKGTVDWLSHDCRIPINDGSFSLVHLFRPDDGHSHYFHTNTDMLIRHVFVPSFFFDNQRERNPEVTEAVNKMFEDSQSDFSIDLKHLIAEPVYQNAIAAVFSQPILGNTSEEYVCDNFITLCKESPFLDTIHLGTD